MSNLPDGCTPQDIDYEMDDTEHDVNCPYCKEEQSEREQQLCRCLSCGKWWD